MPERHGVLGRLLAMGVIVGALGLGGCFEYEPEPLMEVSTASDDMDTGGDTATTDTGAGCACHAVDDCCDGCDPLPDMEGQDCQHQGQHCTFGTCAGGTCEWQVYSAYCYLEAENRCVDDQGSNPDNECEYCDAQSAQDRWAPRPSSTPCFGEAYRLAGSYCDNRACDATVDFCADPAACYDVLPTGYGLDQCYGGDTDSAWDCADAAWGGGGELDYAVGCADPEVSYCGQDAQYPDKETPGARFTIDAARETFTDHRTGLIWQATFAVANDTCGSQPNGYIVGVYCPQDEPVTDPPYPGENYWNGARDYCENLNYAGSDAWELPNIDQLADLAAYGESDPAVPPEIQDFFPKSDDAASRFWSSSPRVDNAWYVVFSLGVVTANIKSYTYSARCVRSGP